MTESHRPPTIPTAERRDAIVAKLSQAFSSGRIELEDFEERTERAMRAQTVGELDATLDGLTGPATPLPAVNPQEFSIDHPRRHVSRLTFVVMGGVDRKGRWAPSRRHVVLAWMGGAFLDFREAALMPGVTHVYCLAKWGGIEIAVPPGIDVEVSGFALMGGLERVSQEGVSTDPRRPRLHFHALAVMGAIEVKVLKPGDKWADAESRDEDDGDEDEDEDESE
jgi:hypothetical protein